MKIGLIQKYILIELYCIKLVNVRIFQKSVS